MERPGSPTPASVEESEHLHCHHCTLHASQRQQLLWPRNTPSSGNRHAVRITDQLAGAGKLPPQLHTINLSGSCKPLKQRCLAIWLRQTSTLSGQNAPKKLTRVFCTHLVCVQRKAQTHLPSHSQAQSQENRALGHTAHARAPVTPTHCLNPGFPAIAQPRIPEGIHTHASQQKQLPHRGGVPVAVYARLPPTCGQNTVLSSITVPPTHPQQLPTHSRHVRPNTCTPESTQAPTKAKQGAAAALSRQLTAMLS